MLLISAFVILAAVAPPTLPYNTNDITKRKQGTAYYWCPKKFMRVHNSCYFLSKKKETWRDASFRCRDIKNSTLAVLDDKWKDKYMRIMLNRSEFARKERWIGGMYNWQMKVWVWGPTGEPFQYKGFSKLRPNGNYHWRCVVMVPSLFHRWSSRSCLEKKHFICELPLKMKWYNKNQSDQMRRRKLITNEIERKRNKERRYRYRARWPTEINNTL
uniref:Putative c-type lectin n=1 Tax=Panstrongylus lignarius TaxID=156445 RepID=A0A224XWG4_9HEMI